MKIGTSSDNEPIATPSLKEHYEEGNGVITKWHEAIYNDDVAANLHLNSRREKRFPGLITIFAFFSCHLRELTLKS